MLQSAHTYPLFSQSPRPTLLQNQLLREIASLQHRLEQAHKHGTCATAKVYQTMITSRRRMLSRMPYIG